MVSPCTRGVSSQLGAGDVRLSVADDLLPRLDQQAYAQQVGQRPGGAEQTGLVAEQVRHPLLQGADGRVLAVHVVPDRGGRHRGPHAVGRRGHRVRTQIDHGPSLSGSCRPGRGQVRRVLS